MKDHMIGWLISFRNDDDDSGNEVIDECVSVELTDATKEGKVELAFDDRGERYYLRFRIQDLLELVMRSRGS